MVASGENKKYFFILCFIILFVFPLIIQHIWPQTSESMKKGAHVTASPTPTFPNPITANLNGQTFSAVIGQQIRISLNAQLYPQTSFAYDTNGVLKLDQNAIPNANDIAGNYSVYFTVQQNGTASISDSGFRVIFIVK